MDEHLRDLERAAQSRPSDQEAARRLDRALARAGEGEALQRRYRLKFRCALSYGELAPSGDPLWRWCARCDRRVHFAQTESALREHVAAGRCVAFARRDLPLAFAQLAEEPAVHSARESDSPCVVAAALPFVDLRARRITPGVAARVPDHLARRLRIVPFAYEGGVLQLAVAELDAAATAEAFSLMLDVPVQLHFAEGGAIAEAIEAVYGEPMFLGAAVLEDFDQDFTHTAGPIVLEPPADDLEWGGGPPVWRAGGSEA